MKKAFVLIALLVASVAVAHDGGHGPKLTDQGKQGGVVSPVVAAKDASKGAKAAMVYKAELTRSEDGMVRVFFYDAQMKPLDLTKFEPSAKAVLEIEKKKQITKTPFTLNRKDNAFIGQLPKVTAKPFNIDVTVKEVAQEWLVAFDNLD